MLRAFGIGCKSRHPVIGVGCELEPHLGDCAAVVCGRVETWPGPEDPKVRKRLNNTVTVMVRRFLETPAERAEQNERRRQQGRAWRHSHADRAREQDRRRKARRALESYSKV